MNRLLIAALVLASQAAMAHEADEDLDLGHWYVQGSYTGADLKDSKNSVESKSAACTNPLNPLPQPVPCSTSAGSLASLFPNVAGPGVAQNFATEYDTGDGFEVSVGYDFPGAFRLDLNVIQFENDIDQINGQPAIGAVKTQQLIGNFWVDFNESGIVQPYLGVGLGASKLALGGADDTVITAHAGLGLNFALGSHFKLDLGYRYYDGQDAEFENATSIVRSKLAGQRLLLGLRYDFLGDAPIPPDADGDGVPDNNDRCPQTPRESKVDNVGCPLDGDRDGVFDYLDQCPATPAGIAVDAKGCDLDDDRDGVPNVSDQCPKTPAGKRVLKNGCQSVVLQGVNFVSGSAELTSHARQVCADVARVLSSAGATDLSVELNGHTDSQGAATANLKLSQQRAEAMRSCLIQNGVAVSRLQAKGYGEYRPVASNGSAEGRARNRRTEMKIINN
ncbi:MAG: OOP family OmpA-OmpF porin [Bermanella sp.]|jgi:OOP family OmpA-OmpF porin